MSENPQIPPLLPLQVEALYYNKTLNKRWRSYLLSEEPDKTVLVRAHGSPLWSERGGFWLPPGPAIEIYPRDEWFNLFCAVDTGDGTWDKPGLHVLYVNIALPPSMRGGMFQYVDLDLDIGINADFSYAVYDEDEFLERSTLWNYPPELRERAMATLDRVASLVEQRDPVFSLWRDYVSMVPPAFLNSTEGSLIPPTVADAS